MFKTYILRNWQNKSPWLTLRQKISFTFAKKLTFYIAYKGQTIYGESVAYQIVEELKNSD